jgi:hypothetical protein
LQLGPLLPQLDVQRRLAVRRNGRALALPADGVHALRRTGELREREPALNRGLAPTKGNR